MSTKPELACAIIEGISSVREELQDFVVEVDGTEFKCHRLILSACSGFFRGLFRSGMKESQKQRTKLEGVAMETFAAILETLYTGCDNLARDNVLNNWLAADQLQITLILDNCVNFITKNICNETVLSIWEVASQIVHKNTLDLCESFLINNTSLENLEMIYSTAQKLESKMILSHVRGFIKKNFEKVITTKAFLCLHENDLLEIIRSEDLVVSTEDIVIESILRWVNYESQIKSETIAKDRNDNTENDPAVLEQNRKEEDKQQFLKDQFIKGEVRESITIEQENVQEDRKQCLERLLSKTRLYLVNPITLEKISRDSLIMESKEAREMVMDAAIYNAKRYQHGQWSQAAMHRRCSVLENVGVMCNNSGVFYALSCTSEFKWFNLPKYPYTFNSTSIKLIAYITDFFAVCELTVNSSVCVFAQDKWRELMTLSGHGWLGVAVEEFVYLINSSNQQIKRFNPRLGNCFLEDFVGFPTRDKIEHICSLDSFIIVLSSVVINNVDKTSVHCLDTRSKIWTRIDSLEESAQKIVSFRKDNQLYILQTNGKLWEVNRDKCKVVNLKFAEVLWQEKYELSGAIYFYDVLYIYGPKRNEKILPVSLFSKIVTNGSEGTWSNIIPAILKKSIFVKI